MFDPVWISLIVILLLTFFPATPIALAAMGFKVGNEGSSSFASLPWLLFITVPSGVVLLALWSMYALACWVW